MRITLILLLAASFAALTAGLADKNHFGNFGDPVPICPHKTCSLN